MSIGLPIVGLATTEMPRVVENGVSGYISSDFNVLIEQMRELITDPVEDRRHGDRARKFAREHFDIRRFCDDWNRTRAEAVGLTSLPRTPLRRAANDGLHPLQISSSSLAEGVTS